ncbi:MAG: hypothetical protein ISS31_10255 [Kiritimatiellae bacterium]|nr:hypothetical protein [Kiritimatiellia bacterium]
MRVVAGLVFIGLLVLVGCSVDESQPQDPPPVEPALRSTLTAWLEAEGETPEDYVVGLFSDHDVVFLGEQHRVKHDALLVQSLLEPLYEAGVYTLATEFGRREDQPLIDSLLSLPEWDEELAREIVAGMSVFWGLREYVDIYRAAWTLNQELPDEAPKFRILGINDSPDWSFITTEADRDDGAIMREVWRGGGEKYWAETILDRVRSGEKVVVYCGIHHAFTEYRQPIVIDGEFRRFDSTPRCGNHVFAALGKRAVTVFLHAPWKGLWGYGSNMRHPADGVIDAVMLAKGSHPVGFDLDRGPFGELRVEDAVYCNGYEDFKLADFCDGWIYTKPISEYEGVTPIPDWVNESNLERAQAGSPNPGFRQASASEFNQGIAHDAGIHRRWGHLR